MFKYRLQVLLDQKVDLKEKAEVALLECQTQLRTEQQKLEEANQRQGQLKQKGDQTRRAMLDGTADTPISGREIFWWTEYLRGLEIDIEAAKDAFFSQKLAVEESEERLSEARNYLAQCAREVEILKKHRGKSERRFRQQEERKEALIQDEIGSTLYLSRKGQQT